MKENFQGGYKNKTRKILSFLSISSLKNENVVEGNNKYLIPV